jgi:hypothetical protein
MNEIDSTFGYWFAGFTDGEGCFTFESHKNKRCGIAYYNPCFSIHLRLDDISILKTIAEKVEVGKIYHNTSRYSRKNDKHASDGAIYMVRGKACQVIVNLFRTYPLLGLKRHDFELWAKAVDISCASKNQIVLKQYKDALHQLKVTRSDLAYNQSIKNSLDIPINVDETTKPLLPIPETIRMI